MEEIRSQGEVTTNLDLFNYNDYRAFLKDFYATQKQRNMHYSYRVFANRAKLASPNYLKLVIDGARRITDKNLPHFVRGLRLDETEAEYFRNLVFFQEARDTEAKGLYLHKLEQIRRKKAHVVTHLDLARNEFLRAWHHSAIREMVTIEGFQDDPSWISSRLGNRITADQARDSLELLLKLEFIRRDGDRYVLNDPLLTTSDEVSSQLIRELHEQFFQLGAQSLSLVPLAEREINGLTIAIPKGKISEFKKAIKEFRKEMNRIFSTEEKSQEVYHLLIGFYPLTRSRSVEEKITVEGGQRSPTQRKERQ